MKGDRCAASTRVAREFRLAWADPQVGLQIVTIDERIGEVGLVDQVESGFCTHSSLSLLLRVSSIINHTGINLCYNLVDPFNVARYAALINPANVAASIRHAKLEKRSLESADESFRSPRHDLSEIFLKSQSLPLLHRGIERIDPRDDS